MLTLSPLNPEILGNGNVDFSTNGVGVLWTASTGAIDSSGLWTPWNRTHEAKVRVWNGVEQVVTSAFVTGVFPSIPTSQSPRKAGKGVSRVDLPSGISYAAARSGTRPAYELNGFGRPWVVEELRQFHAWHYPDRSFVFEDKLVGQMRRFIFDGPLQVNDTQSGRTEWSVPIVAVADTESPFNLTVLVSGLTARAQWLYAGTALNRLEYKAAGDLVWAAVGDWGDQRQASLDLETGTSYAFRAIAHDGGFSNQVNLMTGVGGFGRLFGRLFGGGV